MTQIVHSNSRDTRTKRIAWVVRLMRTRSERTWGVGVAVGATGAVAFNAAYYLRSAVWAPCFTGMAKDRHCRGRSLREGRTATWLPGTATHTPGGAATSRSRWRGCSATWRVWRTVAVTTLTGPLSSSATAAAS